MRAADIKKIYFAVHFASKAVKFSYENQKSPLNYL